VNANQKPPEPDEVEKSRAPLLDHLVELRKRLIRASLALIVCFILVFVFSQKILVIMTEPYYNAVALYEGEGSEAFGLAAVVDSTENFIGRMLGREETPDEAVAPSPVAPPAGAPVLEAAPGDTAADVGSGLDGDNADLVAELQATGPLEPFLVQMKLSLIGALALGFPIVAWQIYAFVAPGLYKKERGALIPFLVAMPFLFILGGALVYYIILPMVMSFALGLQFRTETVAITLNARVNEYFGLVTALLLAFGCMFQLPVVLTLLGKAGIVSAQGLRKAWKYAVVGIFVVAAFITPPDIISQVMLAIPMLLLYEISIWCVKLVERGRAREDTKREAALAE
jgi:sec-independent protein translocase protein TatC